MLVQLGLGMILCDIDLAAFYYVCGYFKVHLKSGL